MSVPEQIPTNQFTIAGGEISGVWTWNLQKESELVVSKQLASTGAVVPLDLGVDYSVNPADLDNNSGGTINFLAPQLPAVAGDVWTLSRKTAIDRSPDFSTSGDFLAVTINEQLDELTRIAQDSSLASSTAVRKDPGVGDNLDPLIPQPVTERALKFRDTGGGNFEMVMSDNDPDQQAGDAAASAAAALASEQAAGVSETNAANSETAAAQSASDASDSADEAAASAASIDLSSPAPIGDVTPNTVKGSTFEGGSGGTTINEFSTDGTLAGDSDDAVPTEKAVKTFVDANLTDLSSPAPIGDVAPNTVKATTFEGDAGGTTINEFSTDVNLAGDSDDAVPTERATKAYADTKLGDTAGVIDQANLKTTTGELTFTSTTLARATTNRTLPGGQYGFFIEAKHLPVNNSTGGWDTAENFNTDTFLQRILLVINGGGNSSTKTTTVRQRFVQASPPYDIGDGEVHSFIFAMVENGSGKIIGMYHAPDPPWANNGPTIIQPEYKKNGKLYRQRHIIDETKSFQDPDRIKKIEQEITNDFKNSDMALIPHPFQGNDMSGISIILIDPNDPIVLIAEEMKNAGESALVELFHNDYVRFGNEHLKGRRTPHSSVMVVKPTWKNSN